jgi:ribosomal protein S28E/S33
MPKRKIMKGEQNVVEENEEKEDDRPRIITRNVKGQLRKYSFLKTVHSLEELDKLRFKVRTIKKNIFVLNI